MAQKRKKKLAVVCCSGGDRAEKKIPHEAFFGDCEQLLELHPEGVLQCEWGCLGKGSCVASCKLGAVFINGYGVAEINWDKCVGCGLCVKACPKELIRITTPEHTIYPVCASRDTGAVTRKVCGVGCIACGICVKNCPADAISIVDHHAVINENRCIACGMCAVKCPRGTIVDADGIFTSSR